MLLPVLEFGPSRFVDKFCVFPTNEPNSFFVKFRLSITIWYIGHKFIGMANYKMYFQDLVLVY